MRLLRDRRRVRRTRSPAASPRSPCVVSPYIDKNPQAERARARAGATRSLRSGDPEVAGFTPPTPQLVPPWSGHGKTSSGPARRVLPRIFPRPTASRVGSLQWVGKCEKGMAALSAKGQSLRRMEGVLFRSPGILGRGCWQGGCRRGLWPGLRVVVSFRTLRRACTTLTSSGLSGPLHHAGLASLGQVAQVAVSLRGCCIPSDSPSLSTSAS